MTQLLREQISKPWNQCDGHFNLVGPLILLLYMENQSIFEKYKTVVDIKLPSYQKMKSEVPLGGESVLFLAIEQYLKTKRKIIDLDNPEHSGQYVCLVRRVSFPIC
jgi:hypothetical protein